MGCRLLELKPAHPDLRRKGRRWRSTKLLCARTLKGLYSSQHGPKSHHDMVKCTLRGLSGKSDGDCTRNMLDPLLRWNIRSCKLPFLSVHVNFGSSSSRVPPWASNRKSSHSSDCNILQIGSSRPALKALGGLRLQVSRFRLYGEGFVKTVLLTYIRPETPLPNMGIP